ncbi:MAG TPA: twin-arginine translocase subunit TatC [Kofleriaceae bacterium]|nr:twin-arginine translocase subunit TatC [Kofleriaceae bacterium]
MAKAEDDDPAEQARLAREAELEEGRMPFLQHLGELRDRVRNAGIAFVVAFLVCWGFADHIFTWLRKPLFDIWIQHTGPALKPGEVDWGPPKLIYLSLTQPFWVNMSVALWAGIFVASPLIFYQLWRFIAPGLYRRERRVAVAFAVLSAVFFVTGALFCFYVALPRLYEFFLGYNSRDLQSLPNITEYLDLTRDSMLAFGVVFEMPLLIYFLAMIGMVTHRALLKFSRWFIVLAFIIGAILTPGPDVMSQLTMALPMIALYFLSILPAWWVTVRRERISAEQRAREGASTKPVRKSNDDNDDDEAAAS